MSQYFKMHPVNPQPRLLNQAAKILHQGGVIVYPTDTTYGLGCGLSNRKGVAQIMRIKQLPSSHQLSVICSDLSAISRLARVDNATYRFLKRFLPGPYTFVLEATREVPKSILPKRKTIGLRIPDHPISRELIEYFGEPLLSTSFRLPGEDILSDPEEIRDKASRMVDLIIDGGICPSHPSTVVDMTGDGPDVLRVGAGDARVFL